jgi:hypothetical protein
VLNTHYFRTRGYRAHRAPGIPCALRLRRAERKRQNLAQSLRRERETVSYENAPFEMQKCEMTGRRVRRSLRAGKTGPSDRGVFVDPVIPGQPAGLSPESRDSSMRNRASEVRAFGGPRNDDAWGVESMLGASCGLSFRRKRASATRSRLSRAPTSSPTLPLPPARSIPRSPPCRRGGPEKPWSRRRRSIR